MISERALFQHVLTQCIHTNEELAGVSTRLTQEEGKYVRLLRDRQDPLPPKSEFFDEMRREREACLEILGRCSTELAQAKTEIEKARARKDHELKPISRIHRKVFQRLSEVEAARAELERRVREVFESCEKMQALLPEENLDIGEGIPATEKTDEVSREVGQQPEKPKKKWSQVLNCLLPCAFAASVAIGIIALRGLQPNLFP